MTRLGNRVIEALEQVVELAKHGSAEYPMGSDEWINKIETNIDAATEVLKGSDPHIEAVVEKMRARAIAGLAKYGVGLDRTDLDRRDWLIHLQEELMDAAAYIERLLSEKNDDNA